MEEHELSLGDVRNDVNHDPLELFRPSKSHPQRSRYATLFVEDDYECSSLRKLFFRNTAHITGGDQHHMLLHTFELVVECVHGSIPEEQKDILDEVLDALRHVYDQVLLPKFPDTVTDDSAWSTLRHAWSDDKYWLSVEELLLIGGYIGPELKIYSHRIEPDGAPVFEALDRGQLPLLKTDEPFERVFLSVDKNLHCGRHFSKLLTDTTWRVLQTAHDAETDSAFGEGSQCSSSEDDDTSSSGTGRNNPSAPAERNAVQATASSSHALPAVPLESGGEELESMSYVSESPDVGDVQVCSNSAVPITREDVKLTRINASRSILNVHPLVPRDPRNPGAALLD